MTSARCCDELKSFLMGIRASGAEGMLSFVPAIVRTKYVQWPSIFGGWIVDLSAGEFVAPTNHQLLPTGEVLVFGGAGEFLTLAYAVFSKAS